MTVEAAHFPDTAPQLPEASVSSSQSPATSSRPGLPSPLYGSGAAPLTEVDYQPDLPQPNTYRLDHWNESLRGLNNPRGKGENDAIVTE
ncbi:hypothetical protein GBAR_LOCUS11956, partial [Geodia barretti]